MKPGRLSDSPNESDPEPVPDLRSRPASRAPSACDFPLEDPNPEALCLSPELENEINKKKMQISHVDKKVNSLNNDKDKRDA